MKEKIATCFGVNIALPEDPSLSLSAILNTFNGGMVLNALTWLINEYWVNGRLPEEEIYLINLPDAKNPQMIISVDILNKKVEVVKSPIASSSSWEKELEINILGYLETLFNRYRVIH